MYIVAFFLPWVSFLIRGRFLYAIICFILQMIVVGWFPAAIWAVIYQRKYYRERHYKEIEKIYEKVMNNETKKE